VLVGRGSLGLDLVVSSFDSFFFQDSFFSRGSRVWIGVSSLIWEGGGVGLWAGEEGRGEEGRGDDIFREVGGETRIYTKSLDRHHHHSDN